MGPPTDAQRRHLHEQGWLIVDDAVPPELLPTLRDAARRLLPRMLHDGEAMAARAPALANDLLRANSQSYLLTPLGGEPCFAEWYGSAELLSYVTAFLERPAEQLCLGDLALFSQTDPSEFNSSWHRDARWVEHRSTGGTAAGERVLVAPDAAADIVAREDRSQLTVAQKGGIGFHLALLDDDHFWIVPRSNHRARTQARVPNQGGPLGLF